MSSGSSKPTACGFRASLAAALAIAMFATQAVAHAAERKPEAPQGPGSVAGAPNLPDGFTRTFTSRYIDIGGVRLHAVIGGKGPPVLLVHGWPQTWYQWRLVMPALARE